MTEIARFDLNLLKLFESIYRLRNLTKVADEIHLTQPAVSHALGRLRVALEDPLFVRTGAGLASTARSDSLIESVRAALAIIEEGLSNASQFQPETCRREFRLLLSDVGELIFLPQLLAYFRKWAPYASIAALQASRRAYGEMLRSRDADVAIGHLPSLAKALKRKRLFRDQWVVLSSASANHAGVLTLQAFESAQHLVVEPPGQSHHAMEDALTRHHIHRNVVLRVPHFFSVPNAIATSDLLVTVPRSVAATLVSANTIRQHELPFPGPVLDVAMYWHERQDNDPALEWLRRTLVKLFAR